MNGLVGVVVAALAAGAGTGLRPYTELRDSIHGRYPQVELPELRTESARRALARRLDAAGADADIELLTTATELLAALRAGRPRGGMVAGIDLRDVHATAIRIGAVHSAGDGVLGEQLEVGGEIVIESVRAGRAPREDANYSAPHTDSGIEPLAVVLSNVTAGGGIYIAGSTPAPASLAGSPYRTHVASYIAPAAGLIDRDAELAFIGDFCRGSGSYLWIRADPWAGKSALLSALLLTPPEGTTAIGFFITNRYAGQSNHLAYTEAVLEQLAALLPRRRAIVASTNGNRDGLREQLLAEAAEHSAAQGKRLVLLVDGLDEDLGLTTLQTTIADLLPRQPHPNLRVIVASRHGPAIPIASDHPLAAGARYLLTPSAHARDVAERAHRELRHLLNGSPEHRRLLGLIAVAHGLADTELEDLTGLPPYRIAGLLTSSGGRSLRIHVTDSPTPAVTFVLAHETLQRSAEQLLGAELDVHRSEIHDWAERYRARAWPSGTPDFLLTRYFRMLEHFEEVERMGRLALDERRHDRLLDSAGGDLAALMEIRTTQQLLVARSRPNLLLTMRLARRRQELRRRNQHIPERLPQAWARIGEPRRGENIAHAIPKLDVRAAALTRMLPELGEQDARRITTVVESLIDAVGGTFEQVAVLTELAVALNGIGRRAHAERVADRAGSLAGTISEPRAKSHAEARVAGAYIRLGAHDRARRVALRALETVSALPDSAAQAQAVAKIAGAVATSGDRELTDRLVTEALILADISMGYANYVGLRSELSRALSTVGIHERAEQLVSDALGLMFSFSTNAEYSYALDCVSAAIGSLLDTDRAEEIASGPWIRANDHFLTESVTTLAGIGRFDRAGALARTISAPALRAGALTEIALAVALAGHVERARTVAESVATAARFDRGGQDFDARKGLVAALVRSGDIDRARRSTQSADSRKRTILLASMLEALAGISDRATIRRIVGDKAFLRALAEQTDLFSSISNVVHALVTIGEHTVAEDIARRTDSMGRTRVFGYLICSLAAAGDLENARRLAEDAEAIERSNVWRTARMSENLLNHARVWADEDCAVLATALAAAGYPSRAEALAATIPEVTNRVCALARVARGTDNARAQRLAAECSALADTIADPQARSVALAELVTTVAAIHDLDRARAFVTAAGPAHRDLPRLSFTVAACTLGDLEQAETAARGITDEDHRATAFIALAEAAATSEPDRARSFLAEGWLSGAWHRPLSTLSVVAPELLSEVARELDPPRA
ncbi:hypothetical protein ACFVMC_18935 [Nocardia sp. NPDC127579]|uniref:hypothetical protein n=1 Tax=Nocardia sp. NPDC127579 TaxID=3345402 RepID=UPI00362DB932